MRRPVYVVFETVCNTPVSDKFDFYEDAESFVRNDDSYQHMLEIKKVWV